MKEHPGVHKVFFMEKYNTAEKPKRTGIGVGPMNFARWKRMCGHRSTSAIRWVGKELCVSARKQAEVKNRMISKEPC